MVAVNSEEIEEMYGWYSEKQHMRKLRMENNKKHDKVGYVYLYYVNEYNNVVLTSEVTKTNEYTSNWDDAIYLGQLYRYYGAFTKPI
jgi:hypothetical protein